VILAAVSPVRQVAGDGLGPSPVRQLWRCRHPPRCRAGQSVAQSASRGAPCPPTSIASRWGSPRRRTLRRLRSPAGPSATAHRRPAARANRSTRPARAQRAPAGERVRSRRRPCCGR
jgi:hypothetical protein